MLYNSFKWKHYEGEIILLNVSWYLKYALSYRNLKEKSVKPGYVFELRFIPDTMEYEKQYICEN